MKNFAFIFIIFIILLGPYQIDAQNNLAANLEVLSTGVEVQRFDTSIFIPVHVEAIVGVGDQIRTDETGSARITFFVDGTDVTLGANTDYRILEFQEDADGFQLRTEVIIGQTLHRLNRVVGGMSTYDVETPGMVLAAEGTEFAIRVENSGRSSMLVFEGIVDAESNSTMANVPDAFGIRSSINSNLSDVVRATTFAELDAALDGCQAIITTPNDISINVRLGPSIEQLQIGVIDARGITRLLGVNEEGNWYRIEFNGGFGWILWDVVEISSDCAGLRVFDNNYVEDTVLYEGEDQTPEETPTIEENDGTSED